MSVALISGSPSARSRSAVLLAEAGRLFGRAGIDTHGVWVRDLPAEDLLHARLESPALASVHQVIDRSWAVVIATPVYKAAAAGILKALLDVLPQNALAGKVILPIGVGGSPAHMLAVDYSLKPVLAALGATTILSTLYAVDKQVRFTDGGDAEIDADVSLRLEDAIRKLIHTFTRRKHDHRIEAIPA